MHFVKIFTALAAVAGLTSAFQDIDTRINHDLFDGDNGAYDANANHITSDIPFTGTAFLRNRAVAAAKRTGYPKGKVTVIKTAPKTPTCGIMKRGEVLRRMEETLDYYEEKQLWRVKGSKSCPANWQEKGDTIEVVDISGCSGLFFFNQDGSKRSAYHITAGNEATEVPEAIKSAQAADTTDSYQLFTYEKSGMSKWNLIAEQINNALPGIKAPGKNAQRLYPLDLDSNRKLRMQMRNEPGSKEVKLSQYNCEEDPK